MKKITITIIAFLIICCIAMFASDTTAAASTGTVDWIEAHLVDILTILGAVYASATALSGALVLLAKLTPWKKDDIVAQTIADVLVGLAKFAARFGLDLIKRK